MLPYSECARNGPLWHNKVVMDTRAHAMIMGWVCSSIDYSEYSTLIIATS